MEWSVSKTKKGKKNVRTHLTIKSYKQIDFKFYFVNMLKMEGRNIFIDVINFLLSEYSNPSEAMVTRVLEQTQIIVRLCKWWLHWFSKL